ncbi:MAG: hypothetical protein PHH36_09110 [Sideroxydans sp.]|nr:hypothetical protein [Sideroxydans sp.]
MKQGLLNFLQLAFLATFASAALASNTSLLDMSDQFDKLDKEDFLVAIERANECTKSRNFVCSERELVKAEKLANSSQDKKVLAAAYKSIAKEKALIAEEERRQRELAREEEEQRELELARREESQRDSVPSFFDIVGAVAQGLSDADSYNQRLQSQGEASIAQGQRDGQAEYERIQRQTANNSTYSSSNLAATSQSQEDNNVDYSQGAGSTRKASPPLILPKYEEVCELQHKEVPISSGWIRSKSDARKNVSDVSPVRAGCFGKNLALSVSNVNCQSKTAHKPDIKNGTIKIVEDGTLWECTSQVSCTFEKCRAKNTHSGPSGASEQ